MLRTLWSIFGALKSNQWEDRHGERPCYKGGRLRHLGPQGIEPRSVVPETTVLSVELQARGRSRRPLGASTPCVEAGACALAGCSLASIAAESRLEWDPVFSRQVVRGRGGFETVKVWTEHFQGSSLRG